MEFDFNEVERVARQICENSADGNGDYDAKGTKKNYWRDRARAVLAETRLKSSMDEAVRKNARLKDAMANIMGGRW